MQNWQGWSMKLRVFMSTAFHRWIWIKGKGFSEKITLVLKDVFIDVSEEGAKAAAVSTLGLKLTQGSSKLIINVDSPFIFSMWSKTFDFPLIVGLVNDPLANTDTVTVFWWRSSGILKLFLNEKFSNYLPTYNF